MNLYDSDLYSGFELGFGSGDGRLISGMTFFLSRKLVTTTPNKFRCSNQFVIILFIFIQVT